MRLPEKVAEYFKSLFITDQISRPNDRVFALDLIRAIAIILVILIHVCAPGCYDIGKVPLDHWFITMATDGFARIGVPLFLMASGYFVLNSRFSFKTRFSKIIYPLLFWGLVFIYYRVNFNGEKISVSRIPYLFISGDVYYHLLFLYALISLYLITPILAVFFENAKIRIQIYLFLIWFVFQSILPILSNIFQVRIGIYNYITGTYFGFFILGCVLKRYKLSSSGKRLAVIILPISTFFIAIMTYWRTVINDNVLEDLFFNYDSLPVVINALAVFMLVKSVSLETPSKWLKILVNEISETSFGIYLCHLLILESLTSGRWGYHFKWNLGHPFIGLSLQFVIVLILSYVVVKIIKQIPFFKKVVG